jgi:hypothetical protein
MVWRAPELEAVLDHAEQRQVLPRKLEIELFPQFADRGVAGVLTELDASSRRAVEGPLDLVDHLRDEEAVP